MTEALHAALTVARAHGLPTDRPRIVRDLTNLLAHLEPAPVVVRVQLTLSQLRGRAWAEREVEAARFLAAAGAPIAPPTDDVDPGPHEQDGLLVTFWRWIDHDESRADPAAAGRALRELHDAFSSYGGGLPTCDRLAEILPLLPAELREFAQSLRPLDGQPIHGDAHLRNVLWSPAGPLWSDLENICRGPREYDLACLLYRPRPDYDAFLRAYGAYDDALVERANVYLALFLAAVTPLIDGIGVEAQRRIERALAYARSSTR